MDLNMSPNTTTALADFLDHEYKKRLLVDRTFSLSKWAEEIGIEQSHLNRMINAARGQPQQISIDVLNKLLDYFGEEMFSILGIKTPGKPRNPMYQKDLNYPTLIPAVHAIADKSSPDRKNKEGK